MCGICGVMASDRGVRVDEQAVQMMNEAMRHRGPDDSGLWHGGHVALAMRRLSIIDLFNGHQPMQSDDGGVTIVFNGEIYNHRPLRTELEKRGHLFKTLSDTEVLLRAYMEYGDGCLEHLNGMFAFAVYDRPKERLLLARDRLGIKPLFYTESGGQLAFASELDALLRSGIPRGGLNADALDAYFTYLYVPAPDTIFKDVYKLRPGELLVCERGQIRKRSYWEIRGTVTPELTMQDAAEHFAYLLGDAVRMQAVSDVPLGALLSGGVDSSTVVALLSRTASAPVKTFTIGFGDAQYDELRHARLVAKHLGTDHTELVMEPDLVEMAGGLTRHFGEPYADSSAIPTWLVSELARRHVTVALSGDGGDELFAGYTWTHMALRATRYGRLPDTVRRMVDRGLSWFPASPLAGKFRRFSADSFMPLMDGFHRRHMCFTPEQRKPLYTADTRALPRNGRNWFGEHAAAVGQVSEGEQLSRHDLRMYLPDDVLTKVDRMSMANALEVRVPMLDHRLVEFAATAPFHLKYHGGISKRLVKHAMAKHLPCELLSQRKQGFAIPVHRWFREALRGSFEEAVLGAGARCWPWLDRASIASMRDRHMSGSENLGHHLWAIMMFEYWLRYIESVPGVSIS